MFLARFVSLTRTTADVDEASLARQAAEAQRAQAEAAQAQPEGVEGGELPPAEAPMEGTVSISRVGCRARGKALFLVSV